MKEEVLSLAWVKSRLKVDRKTLWIYLLLYFCWGLAMNEFGAWAEIARFTYWWQIITVYLIYMVPISLLLREFHWFQQYCYGLLAMGLLEFGGYAIGSSIAYEHNILDQLFSIRNFSLGMTLFFAAYFPLGNRAVTKIRSLL